MLLLTLIRHAKAEPGEPGQADYDRPLSQRGFQDSRTMATWWGQQPSQPEVYLASSARRTHETAKTLISVTNNIQLDLEPRLYGASVGMIWSILAEYDGRYDHIAVVGHNPAISDAACSLCGDNLPAYLPTLGLVHCQLAAFNWSDLTTATGAELIVSMTPKQLAGTLL